jgi:hypothetical protein
MVASYETTEEVFKIVRRHVDYETFKKIVIDLRQVKGNKSFENTMQRLYNITMNEC